MKYQEAEQRFAERMKVNYPPGTRIELINMDDPYNKIAPSTRGTVQFVDDIGTVHPAWDNGSTLGLVPGEDSFRKLTPEEIKEERLLPLKDMISHCSQDELDNLNVVGFDSLDSIFDYIYDEYTTKEDIIQDMSQAMKKQLIMDIYSDRIIEVDGRFFYNSDEFFGIGDNTEPESPVQTM